MTHLYSALLCIAVHPKRFTIMWGVGSLLIHHQCAASTWMMRWLPQNNNASAFTTHQLQVERECHRANPSVWGLLGGHDWQGPVEGIWPGHRGYAPTLYEKCHGTFNDHRESGSRFNVSSERQSFLTVQCPHHYTGVLGPTQTTDVTFIVKSNLKAYWMQFLKHLLHGFQKMGY